VAANTITIPSHGFVTGRKVVLSISGGGTLPDPLVITEDEFVIVVDANTMRIADTLAKALANDPRILTNVGTATKTVTFTPTALAGGVVHLEGSVDKVTWYDIASMTANMTATGGVMWAIAHAGYMYVRVNATVTAGQVAVSAKVGQKGTPAS
jgi:hypothetical protein